MLVQAYQTTACLSYDSAMIAHKIKEDIQQSGTHTLKLDRSLLITNESSFVTHGIDPKDTQTPAFTHPIFLEYLDIPVWALDIRPYTRINTQKEVNLVNPVEYNFQVHRLILNDLFKNTPQRLMGLGDFHVLIFIRWLTQTLVKRFGLDPATQVNVSTITMMYWYSLLRDTDLEDQDHRLLAQKLSRITAIPTHMSLSILEQINRIPDLSAYCSALQQFSGSARLDNINPAFIYAALGGSWFGLNVKELVAVAVEHPPTFCAMIGAAIETRTYQKTGIGMLVRQNDKRGMGANYLKYYQSLIEEYKSTQSQDQARYAL